MVHHRQKGSHIDFFLVECECVKMPSKAPIQLQIVHNPSFICNTLFHIVRICSIGHLPGYISSCMDLLKYVFHTGVKRFGGVCDALFRLFASVLGIESHDSQLTTHYQGLRELDRTFLSNYPEVNNYEDLSILQIRLKPDLPKKNGYSRTCYYEAALHLAK